MQEPTRHDSLTAQLQELDSLQEARVREQEEARIRAAEEARRREDEAARLKREYEAEQQRQEEELRLREERARTEQEERRAREEEESQLRLQLEAERHAKAAQQQRELEHQREMAAINAIEKRKVRNKRLVVGGLVAILLGAAGGYMFGIRPAIERKSLEAEQARQAHELALGEKARAQEALVDAQRRTDEAVQDKEQLQERIQARDQRRKERDERARVRPASGAKKKPKTQDCAPDDPLCGLKLD
ncbi:MAG: hypothetical protein WBG86_17145 [Polyangiales bacterium]